MRKIAIITGASSGIGGAAAIALADREVDSIVTYKENEKGVTDVVAEVRRRGGKAVPLRLDVGCTDSFVAFEEEVVKALESEWGAGRFDYLVNNAGAGRMAYFSETSEALFDECLQLLLKGPYFLTQRLLPLMADGGAIVNTASSSALPSSTEEGYSAYASMKGALIVWTRCIAKELSKRGIRANSIAPGPTKTRIGNGVFESHPEVIPPLVELTALGRLGESSDIGDFIAALLSEDCRWVTGQCLEVSGGYRL